jgi:stage III sporulation protein AB
MTPIFIKVFASMIIIFGSGLLGARLGLRFSERERELIEIENFLTVMRQNIGFLNLPLSRAVSEFCPRTFALKKIFAEIADKLSSGSSASPGEIFRLSFGEYKIFLNLSDSDLIIIFDFAEKLGCADAEGELANINLALERISAAKLDCKEDARKNVKLYKGIGFLTGIVAAVLLI